MSISMSILISVILSVILSLFFAMFLIAKSHKKYNFNRYASIANMLDKKIEIISKYENKIDQYRDILESIPKQIDKLTNDCQNFGINKELIDKCSKSITKIEERFEKLSLDYKKLLGNFEKNNSETMLNKSFKDIKNVKIEIANGLKEFDKKSKEVLEELKRGGAQYIGAIDEKKKGILKDVIYQKEYVKEFVNNFQLEYTGLVETISELKDGLINTTNEDLSQLINSYDDKISNIKETMKTERNNFERKIDEKIKDFGNYITKIEDRGENLKSNIDKFLGKIRDDYVSDIRENYAEITEELKEYNDNLKSDILKELKDSYDRYSKQNGYLHEKICDIGRKIDEKQTLIESLVYSVSEKVENIKNNALNELAKRLEEFNFYIESASDKGIRLEFDIFNKIKLDINNFELEINEKWNDFSNDLDNKLETYRDTLRSKYDLIILKIDDLENSLTKSANDIDCYKGDFKLLEENTTNKMNLLEENFNEINKNIDNRYQRLYDYFNEKGDIFQKEILNNLDIIRFDIDKNIETLNNHFTTEYEKIIGNINNSISSISNDANNRTNDIVMRFEEEYSLYEKKLIDVSNNVDKKSQDIENEIIEKSDLINLKVKDRMENIETIILDRQTRFEIDIKDISLNYEKKIKNFDDKIGKLIKNSEDKNIAKMEETYKQITHFDKEFNNYTKNISIKFKKIEEDSIYLESKIKEREASFQSGLESKIIKFEESFLKKSRELFKDSETKFNKFKAEFDNIENNLKILKSDFTLELNKKIENQKNNLDDFFNLGRENLNNYYEKLEDGIIAKIELYKKEFGDLNDTIKNYEIEFNSYFNDQMKKYDILFSEKVESSDKEYRDSFELFLKQSNDVIISKSSKIEELLSKVEFIDKKLEQFNHLLSNDFERILKDSKENLVKKYNELENNSKLKLQAYKNEFDSTVSVRLADSKNEIDTFFKNEFNGLIIKYKKHENDLLDRIGDFKKELFKIEQNLKTLDERATTRFLEHTNNIDRRIQDASEHIKRLDKQIENFDYFEITKDKLLDDTRELKLQFEQLRKTKDVISSVENRVEELTNMFSIIEEKYDSLLINKERVDDMSKSVGEMESLIIDLNKKIGDVKDSKNQIINIENEINSANHKLDTISNIYEMNRAKAKELDEVISSFNDVKTRVSDMTNNFNTLNKKYDELDIKRTTFEKVIKNFEKEASYIIKSGGNFSDIIDKFKQMDHLIEDIDERIEIFNRLREWLVKSESEIENMNRETDNRIRLLESLLDKASVESENYNSIKEQFKSDKKKPVLQLKEQGYTIDDIAKMLNLSIGEVEFVLNLDGSIRKR